jgi:hypothetical protein
MNSTSTATSKQNRSLGRAAFLAKRSATPAAGYQPSVQFRMFQVGTGSWY